jgi:PAS domain S-box-containing protein
MVTNGVLRRVTLISPDPDLAAQLRAWLAPHGYLVTGSPDPADVHTAPSAAVLLDGRTQFEPALLALMRMQTEPEAHSSTILLLAEDPADELLDVLAMTHADYLLWPTRPQALVARLTLMQRQQRPTPHAAPAPDAPPPNANRTETAPSPANRDGLFRRAFDLLPFGAMIVSPTNQIEYVNAAFCQFLGYSRDELIGRQPGFMVLPEDHAATLTRGHLLAAGQLDHLVQERRRYVRKDGSIGLGKLTVYAPRDQDGHLLAFLAFVENISKQVWVEDQLARYTRYQQALSNASLALLTVAPDEATRATALRAALQQMLDGAATSRAYLFRNVLDAQLGLSMELSAEAWAAGQRSLDQRGPASKISRLPYAILPQTHREVLLAGRPSGGFVEELYATTPELLHLIVREGIRSTQTVPVHVDGQLWGFLGFDDHTQQRVWDHTDLMLLTSSALMFGQTLQRWQIEDDLRATSQFLHTTGRVAGVGGWAADLEHNQLQISDELATLLELESRDGLNLERMLAFYAPEAQTILREAVAESLDSGGEWELELPMITTRGRPIWVNAQGYAEQRDGRTVRLYGVVQDVTRRKAAELRLERQLKIEAALVKCSRELLVPVRSEDDLRQIAAPALEHLRAALAIDQAYLMRVVPDPDDPYFTMVAFATIPIGEEVASHPLAQRFALALMPPQRRARLEAGEVLMGLPREAEMTSPDQRSLLRLDRAATRLTLPILIDGTLWGILGFNGLSERAWDEQEQTVLRTAAEMFGHVIRRRSAEDDLRRSEEQFRSANTDLLRRVNELRTLNMVAQTLAFTQDLRAGFETVCAAAAELTGATAATLVGLRQHHNPFRQPPAIPELDQLMGTSGLDLDELGSSTAALLTQHRTLNLSRNAPDFPLTPATLQRLHCPSAAHLLIVLLSAPTGNLGLFVLWNEADAQPFTADDQSLAETMAGQIATAISNVQLGEQARRAAALAERNRVARDLHDSATQTLYSMVLLASGWALRAENGRLTEIPAKFKQIGQIAVQVLKELRLLIYQLRHPDLEAGLISALEERLAAVEQRANITTTLEVTADLTDLPPEYEEELYVILQEALNNALRHAEAQQVTLKIYTDVTSIVFCVSDDGRGFDPSAPSAGLGLRSMRERADKLGAELILTAQPNHGTRLEIRVPVPSTGGDARG